MLVNNFIIIELLFHQFESHNQEFHHVRPADEIS